MTYSKAVEILSEVAKNGALKDPFVLAEHYNMDTIAQALNVIATEVCDVITK